MSFTFLSCYLFSGLRILMDVFKVTPGTVQSCINLLKEGHVLAIAPGNGDNNISKHVRCFGFDF